MRQKGVLQIGPPLNGFKRTTCRTLTLNSFTTCGILKIYLFILPPKPEGIVNNNIETFIPGVICYSCKICEKNIRKKRKNFRLSPFFVYPDRVNNIPY